jgi:tetratricopeptide (TPR) repeat protein
VTAAAEPPNGPLSIAQLMDDLAAAKKGEDDRRIILVACQLMARADLMPGDRLQVLKQRALARYRHSHFAASADDWSQIIEINPADRTAFVSRGACEYGSGSHRVALDELLAVEARFGPPDADELIWRGACLYGLGDIAGARRELKAAGALEPENPTIWRWRASISSPYEEDLPTALEEVALAMAALPETGDLHLRHARILEALGRRQEAIAASDAALRLEPERVDLLKYRAGLKLADGDLEGALADLIAVAALAPYDIDAQEAPVEVLRQLGRLDEALEAADRLAEAFGDRYSVHKLRADVLRDRGDTAGTIEALRAASKAAPPWEWDFGCKIAALLRELGDLAGAHETLERMNRTYFTLPVGQALFEVLSELGRFTEALEVAGQIVKADPSNAEAYRKRARLLSARGRVKEARADLKVADSLNPGPREKL